MNRRTAIWIHGLASAAISGSATSIAAIVVAPESFNFGPGLTALGQITVVGALIGVANYLKESPLPHSVRKAP